MNTNVHTWVLRAGMLLLMSCSASCVVTVESESDTSVEEAEQALESSPTNVGAERVPQAAAVPENVAFETLTPASGQNNPPSGGSGDVSDPFPDPWYPSQDGVSE